MKPGFGQVAAVGALLLSFAVPQAAQAVEFTGTVADQTFYVDSTVNLLLPGVK